MRNLNRGIQLSDVMMGLRFLTRLPGFLSGRLAPEEAANILRTRLQNRASNFLRMVRDCIFANPLSIYRELLELAGCRYGELVELVERDGIEATLRTLCSNGVYLTVDEFKGRQPVVRGSCTLQMSPLQLRNPLPGRDVMMSSGGSRSPGTPVVFSLSFIRECGLDTGLALGARGGDRWLKACWEVPGGGAFFSLLEFSVFGLLPARWFSHIDPAAADLHLRYRMGSRALVWGSRLAGRPLPRPEYAPLDNPLPIVHWIHQTVQKGEVPYLLTYPSSAVRLCRCALDAGTDLQGARFAVAGEPCTETRMEFIRSAGAEVSPKYAIMETGPVGYGCLSPEKADEIHIMTDIHAIIQPPEDEHFKAVAPGTVLFTSLLPTAPLVLLNVSMGDQAQITSRECGCALEQLGWNQHMHTIQSFEKLTCGGMNFLDSDVIRVMDQVLPQRFGGGPTDYQILEDQEPDGSSVIRLLVRPSLGPLNERDVAEAFLNGISRGNVVERVMGLTWRDMGLLKVERREPLTTRSGKILHMHVTSPT